MRMRCPEVIVYVVIILLAFVGSAHAAKSSAIVDTHPREVSERRPGVGWGAQKRRNVNILDFGYDLTVVDVYFHGDQARGDG